ncbi:MAG: TatD family hydrolase, partial [Planctomycetes bacterium]|nr:TatD family hydrolase [Planctomycetota bacterium]
VVAVGEVGLDLYHSKDFSDEQVRMFQAQIELALEYDLPLILHCREAFDLLWECLSAYKSDSRLRGVWHCFDGSLEQAEKMMAAQFEISISGIVTYKNATELQDVISKLPIERLLVETDCPYLAPMPKRGRANEPAYVDYILTYLSSLLQKDKLELARQTSENTRRLFAF